MVTLDRGLEEALALLCELERHVRGDAGDSARMELAILAVERARHLLADRTDEILHHENW
jgi:hypothetical protein